MLKHLSPYTDEQLVYLLARIREIAALGDEAALIETDKIVWEILDDQIEGGVLEQVLIEGAQDYSSSYGVQRIESTLKDMREKLETQTLREWDLYHFQNAIRFIKPEAWQDRV